MLQFRASCLSSRVIARDKFPDLRPGQVPELLALGTQNKVLINPREVYSLALQQNASGIIPIHNHPSGRLKPSPADKSITQQLMKGSEFVNLRLLDHLIISEEGYFSFMDEGIFEILNAELSSAITL
jgi:hypothetical protein